MPPRESAHPPSHVRSSSALSASVAHRLLPATAVAAEERLPHRYRTFLACALAVFAVFGCVAVGWITAGSPDPSARVSAGPITGAAALRPDVLAEHEWPPTGADRNGGPDGAERQPELAPPAVPIVRSAAPPADEANPAAGSDASAVRVAEEFYRRLADSPSTAPELLTPSLRGQDPGALVRAWSAADRIQHRVRSVAEHRAVVRLAADFPDGRHVVLHQRLSVEAGSNPRIRDAELLSGRYAPGQ